MCIRDRGKYCFQCQLLFSRCKLCLRYTTGNFNENLSMRAVAKILRARASEHSSNFCEQFEQRPNFPSTFKLDGTIRYPYRPFPHSSRSHARKHESEARVDNNQTWGRAVRVLCLVVVVNIAACLTAKVPFTTTKGIGLAFHFFFPFGSQS